MQQEESSRFGFESTAAEVAAGVDLAGRVAVVTGASGGLGAESARVLASHGARVRIGARDVAKGEKVAAEIRRAAGNGAVTVGALELRFGTNHRGHFLLTGLLVPAGGFRLKKVEQGAATLVWAATARELAGRGGLYLEDCHIAGPSKELMSQAGYAPWALDADAAARLWTLSEQLVGATFC